MIGFYQENLPLNLYSLESYGQKKVHNNPLNQNDDINIYGIEENPCFNFEENTLVKETDEEMNKEEENDFISNICCNKGQLEDSQDSFVTVQNPESSNKEYEIKKLYFINENGQKEDNIERDLSQNDNQNQNKNEIENKKEEKTFNEKSKEKLENIIENENKKEENSIISDTNLNLKNSNENESNISQSKKNIDSTNPINNNNIDKQSSLNSENLYSIREDY